MGSISDWAWFDVDEDGIQDDDEAGFEGVKVELFQDGELLETQYTDTGGEYGFSDLAMGTYVVEFTAPDGYDFSPADQGGDDTKDSDAASETVTLSETGTIDDDTVDAGIIGPTIDIDTDNNNNNTVGDAGEDEIEEIADKRIFLNLDDDDKNGVADRTQVAVMSSPDKDLTLTTITLSNLAQQLPNYSVKLVLSDGLRAWGSRHKDTMQFTNQYEGTITFTNQFPSAIWIEGKELGFQTATAELYDGGGMLLHSDVVHYDVQEVIWPYLNAGSLYPSHPDLDYNQGNSADWDGIKVSAGWWTEKTLIDYIIQPGDTGRIATRHPDTAPIGTEPTDRSTNGPDSTANQSHGQGTLTFEYKFDLRGGNQYGYVQAHLPNHGNADQAETGTPANPGGDKDRTELGFISNSGIRFSSGEEINIIDTDNVIALAKDDFDYEDPIPNHVRYVTGFKGIDTTGKADIRHHILGIGRDFGDAYVTQLTSGVIYDPAGAYNAAKYGKMPDFANIGAAVIDWNDFRAMLHTNAGHNNGGYNTMQITLDNTGLTVKINGATTYRDANYVGTFGAFTVQSHWGSGVIYRNMDFQ